MDGALLEDVTIDNITMRDIVNDPIFLRLGARMRGPAGTPVGELRRVLISNVVVYNADPSYGCTISGIPDHDIEDIRLNNIHIYYRAVAQENGQQARDQQTGGQQAGDTIPENENKYPEPGMFGRNPAYGLFVRHAKDIQLTDVQFHAASPGDRPALFFEDVKGAYLEHVLAEKTGVSPDMVLQQVTDLSRIHRLGLPDQIPARYH